MIIKLQTLLRPEISHENLQRLARWLDLDLDENLTKPELALEVVGAINDPIESTAAWMKPGSWRE